jgi:hypothetical protein
MSAPKRERLEDDTIEAKAKPSPVTTCFGISTRQLQRGLVQCPELNAAIQAGNDVFNSRNERALAEEALLHTAFYTHLYTWPYRPFTQLCTRPLLYSLADSLGF